jgi:hypothetical protein
MAELAASAPARSSARPLSSFETWPPWLFYAPVFVFWFWLAIRYRGLTLPATANTAPVLSGFLGEAKSDVFALLGARGRNFLPPYAVFSTCAAGRNAENETRAAEAMQAGGLNFPVVGKPDSGQNGAGVKIIRDPAALTAWLRSCPPDSRMILQGFIAEEGEAGVFYIRYPGEARGRIASLTLKYFPYVTGDGASTLRDLILGDARARRIAPVYFVRHAARLDHVVPAGEQVRLVSVGNHCRGAIFKNGAGHITPQMESAFDAIAREIPGFFFGRFDVRFAALGDLERGEKFSILEINGADSEMTHIWDSDETLLGAYRALYGQFRAAFEIAAINRARGTPAATLGAFLRAWWRTRTDLRRLPLDE